MRLLVLTAVSIGLVGCGDATSANPDSSNPAHCLAVFTYDAHWFKLDNQPEKVAEYIARGLYVLEKARLSGGSQAQIVAEAKTFSRDHANDDKQMDKLGLECGKALAGDSRFRAEFPSLIEKARPLVPQFEAVATP